MKNIIYLSLCLLTCLSISCGEDLPVMERNNLELDEYIADNNLQNVQTSASGLRFIIEDPGANFKPDLSNEVTVKYRGYFTDGDEFDSSDSATFMLNGLIQGWQEGLQLFGKGGKGVLLVPSWLGYGSFPPSGIPRDAVLIFDIELIDFQ